MLRRRLRHLGLAGLFLERLLQGRHFGERRFCHFGNIRRDGSSSRQFQGHQGAVQTHGIGRSTECLRLPVRCRPRGNVVRPLPEGVQGIPCQPQQGSRHRLLLGEPGIEHLLHRPGRLAELIQPHHARTALEGVESAPQRGLLAQVAGLLVQCGDGCEPLRHDLARLFQEHLAQFFVFRVRHRWRGLPQNPVFGCGGRGPRHSLFRYRLFGRLGLH